MDCSVPADAAEVRSRGWLFVLADGVGGQDAGEVASRIAVDSILSGFRAAASPEPHTSLLARLVQAANADVYESRRRAATSMATTVVSCALRFASAVIAHVGDSRCYLIRRGEARLLTEDHTLVAQQARMKLISAEEAARSSVRHVLTRSLGGEMFVQVDTRLVDLEAGDTLLLSSDGLHNEVTAREISAIVGACERPDEAAEELIALANEKDGSDNISLQLVRVRAVERMGMYRGRPYKLY